jgi:DNA-binding NarL/FixJ family response regulator
VTELPQNRIRILSVDDHEILREGVAALIAGEADMELVAEAATGREAIDLASRLAPNIVLVDLSLPDMSGIDVIHRIRIGSPSSRMIVLTTFKGDVQALRSFKAGATGYLLKSMVRKELVPTIRGVHGGSKVIAPEISQEIASFVSESPLTEREIEVLRHVARGRSNKVIAGFLCLSEDTVKGHVRNVLAKLGANDRTHAVVIATRRGYFDLDE